MSDPAHTPVTNRDRKPAAATLPKFSMARLLVAFTLVVVGVGRLSIGAHAGEFFATSLGQMLCFATVGIGLLLPFMRTTFAIIAGGILGCSAYQLLLMWAFSRLH